MARGKYDILDSHVDEMSKMCLYEGLSLSQLAVAFGQDKRTISEKLASVPPDGIRRNYKVWRIKTAAPYLIKPAYDIETYIRNMNYAELPKALAKEFWAGMKSKQDYELRAGDLWPTSKVVAEVGELYKLMSMSLKLLADTVNRQAELTPKQRQIINDITDGTQRDLKKKIETTFKTPRKSEETPVNYTANPKVETVETVEEDDDDSL